MAYSNEEQANLLVEIAAIHESLTPRGKIKTVSGDDLSIMGVRLAALKASVIDLKVDAEVDMLNLEVQKDEAKAEAYEKAKKEHGSTAASDIKYKDPDFVKAQNEYHNAKVNFNRLKSILADAHDLIEAITGRMIELHGARKDERVG